MEKVIAVVVTYNRHSDLSKCIEALRNQSQKLDAILVVNNGSSDYTSVWLDQQTDIINIYQDNSGSAGGYYTGIKWAYENGYNQIWCMDDDGYPKFDALEALIKNEGHELALLNSTVVNKTDKKSLVWDTKNYKYINEVQQAIIENIAHPFNGTLLNSNIIAKVGLPLTNLFCKGAETEYFFRITKQYKIPAKTITNSIYYHNEKISLHTQEWDIKTCWSVYYFLRNRYAVLKTKHTYSFKALSLYLIFMMTFVGEILFYQKNDKVRKISFVFWPMRDALVNNYTATPKTIITKINYQYNNSFSKLILLPLRNYICSLFVPSFKETSTPVTI